MKTLPVLAVIGLMAIAAYAESKPTDCAPGLEIEEAAVARLAG